MYFFTYFMYFFTITFYVLISHMVYQNSIIYISIHDIHIKQNHLHSFTSPYIYLCIKIKVLGK